MSTTPKRSRGRPKGRPMYPAQIHVYLDADTAGKLKHLAREAELSESAYVRKLIREQGETQ